MSAKRLSMRKIREILRLKQELGLSHRSIARSLHIAVGTVSEYNSMGALWRRRGTYLTPSFIFSALQTR